MTKQKRLPYFDFLRGIAIIMVVGIHTFNVNTANIASIPLRTLICCAVPLFITLSAFFVSQKEFKDGSFFKWFINQTKKIYIPMLLWSIPYLIISIHDNTYTLRYTLFLYFLGGFSIYYFISFIIQGYLFMPILKKINIMGGGDNYKSIMDNSICVFTEYSWLLISTIIFRHPFSYVDDVLLYWNTHCPRQSYV